MDDLIIGVDLGTTKSVVAVWQDGAPRVLADHEGRSVMPSILARAEDGRVVAGHRAAAISPDRPEGLIASVKRLVGRRYSDEQVRETAVWAHDRLLYEIAAPAQGSDQIELLLDGLRLSPQQASAYILAELRQHASTTLGAQVNRAVVTVPAYFNDTQRQATRDAGRIAGLQIERILNEPTAACLAYGYRRLGEERRTVAVYDLGGGTFDISIVEMGGGRPFRVRGIGGDPRLGGDDIDWAIVEWAIERLDGPRRERLRSSRPARLRLRDAARRAKVALTTASEARLLIDDDPGAELALTRQELDRLAAPLLERTVEPCRQALRDAGLSPGDIAELLLVGGQTRSPAVRQLVAEIFGREPDTSLHPEEVVAIGASVWAAQRAGALSFKLHDVVPLSLGVKIDDDGFDRLIPRNTWVPYRIPKPRIYTTRVDNQESVEIEVYQGERPFASENTRLGTLRLDGLPPARRGEPAIEVTFEVDSDGILRVSAADMQTGERSTLRIADSLRLTDDEIAEAVAAAKANAEADQARIAQAGAAQQLAELRRRLAVILEALLPLLSAELVIEARAALGRGADEEGVLSALQALIERAEAEAADSA